MLAAGAQHGMGQIRYGSLHVMESGRPEIGDPDTDAKGSSDPIDHSAREIVSHLNEQKLCAQLSVAAWVALRSAALYRLLRNWTLRSVSL